MVILQNITQFDPYTFIILQRSSTKCTPRETKKYFHAQNDWDQTRIIIAGLW